MKIPEEQDDLTEEEREEALIQAQNKAGRPLGPLAVLALATWPSKYRTLPPESQMPDLYVKIFKERRSADVNRLTTGVRSKIAAAYEEFCVASMYLSTVPTARTFH